MESTLAGYAAALFSDTRAAARTCTSIIPEFSPGCGVKKPGIGSLRLGKRSKREQLDGLATFLVILSVVQGGSFGIGEDRLEYGVHGSVSFGLLHLRSDGTTSTVQPVCKLAQNDPHLEVSFQQRDQKLTDDCLAPLKDLKSLVHLNLRGQEVTDASMPHLKDLTGLTRLHLENTKITDKGLASLKDLKNLAYLNLYGTAVTDAGLDSLKGLTNLRHLYLWQTKVTEAGVKKLKVALPNLEIVAGWETVPEPAKK